MLARNEGNQPQSLILTHLPLFPPSLASSPLPSPPSSSLPSDLIPSNPALSSRNPGTQTAAGAGAELSGPASIANPWDQDSFFPPVSYSAEHTAKHRLNKSFLTY